MGLVGVGWGVVNGNQGETDLKLSEGCEKLSEVSSLSLLSSFSPHSPVDSLHTDTFICKWYIICIHLLHFIFCAGSALNENDLNPGKVSVEGEGGGGEPERVPLERNTAIGAGEPRSRREKNGRKKLIRERGEQHSKPASVSSPSPLGFFFHFTWKKLYRTTESYCRAVLLNEYSRISAFSGDKSDRRCFVISKTREMWCDSR